MRMTLKEFAKLAGASSFTPQSVPLEVTTHQVSGLLLHIPRFVPSSVTSPEQSKAAGSRKRKPATTAASALEEDFARQLRLNKMPRPAREHRFDAKRRWRFDFAWPDQKVAVEIEGGIWSGGRHTRGAGFLGDCDKYNAAQLAGWLVLRFAAPHLQDKTAIQYAREALGINHDKAGE